MSNKQGGRRANAGRKKMKVKERKVPVSTYHRKIDLDKIGIKAARVIAHEAIEAKIAL